ncbi:MAG: hypothetical protein R2876_00615 [Eubacteriales bacterium]
MYLSIVLTVVLLILTVSGCFNKAFFRARINKLTFIIFLVLFAIAVLMPEVGIYGVSLNLAIPLAFIFMIAALIKKPKYGIMAMLSAILLAGIIYMVERTLDISEYSMNGLAYIETGIILIIISIMSKDAVIAAAAAYFCSVSLLAFYILEHVLIGDTYIYLDMDLSLARAAAATASTMILTDITHSIAEWFRRRKEELKVVHKNA